MKVTAFLVRENMEVLSWYAGEAESKPEAIRVAMETVDRERGGKAYAIEVAKVWEAYYVFVIVGPGREIE